ncbi:MAG: hypothetical protein D6795_11935 [Deltaproteobacteria bacterium]|nr:MAG: hypothetical protein D6795_11935 [Deltaproteobacteria bacterium]
MFGAMTIRSPLLIKGECKNRSNQTVRKSPWSKRFSMGQGGCFWTISAEMFDFLHLVEEEDVVAVESSAARGTCRRGQRVLPPLPLWGEGL